MYSSPDLSVHYCVVQLWHYLMHPECLPHALVQGYCSYSKLVYMQYMPALECMHL